MGLGVRVDFSACRTAHFYNTHMPSYCAEYFKYFQPGPITEEPHELHAASQEEDDSEETSFPDADAEDYLKALEVYEDHLRRADEALTPVELLYWQKRLLRIEDMWHEWWPYFRGKGISLGKEIAACIFAGGMFIFLWWFILAFVGPLRFKTVGIVTVAFIIVSTIIRESIDVAATSAIGACLVGFYFFTRISSGYGIEYHRDRREPDFNDEDGAGDADGEYSVILKVKYWYCGDHSFWINLSKGLVGVD